MRHVMETRPLQKLDQRVKIIHERGEKATKWLENLNIRS